MRRLYDRIWLFFFRGPQVHIDVCYGGGEWVRTKTFPGRYPKDEWDEAVQEVCKLNLEPRDPEWPADRKFRAFVQYGGMASVYCSGFYTFALPPAPLK